MQQIAAQLAAGLPLGAASGVGSKKAVLNADRFWQASRYAAAMIDHMSIQVADYEKSKTFYLRALGPLGYSAVMELTREQIPELPSPAICGLGEQGKPDFWLAGSDKPATPQHLAFRAESRAAVDAFYKAALAGGAKSNGEPGLRPHYHPNYYGAFVIDLNGHNLEAVCHTPE